MTCGFVRTLSILALGWLISSCAENPDFERFTTDQDAKYQNTFAVLAVPRSFFPAYSFCPVEVLSDNERANAECRMREMLGLFAKNTGFYSPYVNNNYFKDGFMAPMMANPVEPDVVLSPSEPKLAYLVWPVKSGRFAVTSLMQAKFESVLDGAIPVFDIRKSKVNYLGGLHPSGNVLNSGRFSLDVVRSDFTELGHTEWVSELRLSEPTVAMADCEYIESFWENRVSCQYELTDRPYPNEIPPELADSGARQ